MKDKKRIYHDLELDYVVKKEQFLFSQGIHVNLDWLLERIIALNQITSKVPPNSYF